MQSRCGGIGAAHSSPQDKVFHHAVLSVLDQSAKLNGCRHIDIHVVIVQGYGVIAAIQRSFEIGDTVIALFRGQCDILLQLIVGCLQGIISLGIVLRITKARIILLESNAHIAVGGGSGL